MNIGENIIRRKSTESNVTIPYEQTFRNLDNDRPADAGSPEVYKFNFCGCGWPHHMLIPRGRPESDGGGLPCQLFAMISNFEEDAVEQDTEGACTEASSYCGIRDRLYPDRRKMGFPFDRPSAKNDGKLDEFLLPNMKAVDCNIIFSDEVVERGKLPNARTVESAAQSGGNKPQ